MRIGITCYPTVGGSGVIATELGMALAKRGDWVHFISYAMPSRLEMIHERIRFHEVNVTPYPLFDPFPPYTLALASKMAEVAAYENLDLLHVHYAIPHAISGFLAKQILGASGLKVITTLHGTDITLVGKDASYLPITRFGIEASDGVTAVSQSLRNDTTRNFATEKDIRVIPNFVDTEQFRRNGEASRVRQYFATDEKIVCHVSNFRPVKRVLDIMEVFARIHEKVPSKLLMVGDGPDRSSAEQFCRDRGLCDKVVFLGQISNVEQVLGACDLFVLPSETESFGMGVLEAMSCEVPVIATNAGGLPEVVPDGEAGYLLPVGDVEAMAERALEILCNPELAARMARTGRQVAVEKFAMEKVVPQYEDFYDEVLGS